MDATHAPSTKISIHQKRLPHPGRILPSLTKLLIRLRALSRAEQIKCRERMIARFSIDETQEGFALGYIFDIVLRGTNETVWEGRA